MSARYSTSSRQPPSTRADAAGTSRGASRGWGGARAGAGRKPGPRPRVPHRERPAQKPSWPAHVTLRRAPGLPSLRSERLHRVFVAVVRRLRRPDFRVVHYSVQTNHVHLIVEAHGKERLSSGLRSLVIRLALALNRRLGRTRGRVWGDRYHRTDITSARQARRALVYVLANVKKHDPRGNVRRIDFIDTLSSGPWFDGWLDGGSRAGPSQTDCPVPPPQTDFLMTDWKRFGLISLAEAPALTL